MNFYSFHIGDYAAHTKHLTPIEDIAYRRMLDLYYTSEKPLPLDPNQLARLTGLREHMAEVQTVVSEFFTKTDDGYRSKRCDEEISLYRTRIEQASRAGKASAQRRFNGCSTDVQPTNPINHEPITNTNLSNAESETLPAVKATPYTKVGFDYQAGRWVGLIDNRPLFESWMQAYPAVDIRSELNSMRAWLMSNRKNRKTNMERFVNNWLSKAQDRAVKPGGKTFAEQKQDYLDQQAEKFYQPLLNATPDDLAKWGLA